MTYGRGSTRAYYRIWTGSSWLGENSLAAPGGSAGDVNWTLLASDPTTNRIVLGVLTTNKDVWVSVWDGTSWEAPVLATNSTVDPNWPNVAVAFEGQSGQALLAYAEAASVRYRTWASGTGWSPEGTAANIGAAANTMTLDTAPGKDAIMLGVHDNSRHVSYTLWDGAAWGALSRQEDDTKESGCQPFIFIWDRPPPVPDLEVSKLVDNATPHIGDTITYSLAVTNVGSANATGVALADALPSGVTYRASAATRGTYDPGSDIWTVGPVNAGDHAGLAIQVTVDAGTQGRSITNVAAVSAIDQVDPEPANDRDSVTVAVANRAPVLAPIGAKSVGEGQHLQFLVSASDSDGTAPSLRAAPLPANATFVDNGNGTGTFDFTPGYTQAGSYSILFIASDGALADSELVAVTVVPAPLAYLVIAPDRARVSADSTLQFTATGYDAGGDEVDAATITWSLTVDVGTIDATGFFDAQTVGHARVIAASSLGPADTTSDLEVVAGRLAALTIAPDRATVSADSTQQFAASGHDADGNLVTAGYTLAWEVLGGIGNITASGLFSATHAGKGFIKATTDLGVWAQTDTVTVVPGAVASIDVTPSATAVIEGSACQFSANAYDADGNLINDCTSLANWSTTDPSGSITVGGLYTAGHAISPPAFFVKAALGARRDSSVVTVLTSGALNHVVIEWLGGAPCGDTTLTTDSGDTKLYCRGYNSAGGLLGDISVTWSTIGGPIGTVTPGPATSTTLRVTHVGTGRVVALYGPGVSDTTGIITCTAGRLARLEIAPDSAATRVGGTINFSASGFDAYGNSASVGTLAWSVIGGVGTIDAAGVFTASTSGSGRVATRSSIGGVADTNRVVVVVGNPLASIVVSPDTASVKVNDTVTFIAHGFDEGFEPVEPGALTWQVSGGIGRIDGAGVFVATRRGKGHISVTDIATGLSDTTGLVVVDLPTVAEVPLGDTYIHAADLAPVVAFQVHNAFGSPKAIKSVKVRDSSRGGGTAADRLSNVHAVAIYSSPGIKTWPDPSFTRLAEVHSISGEVTLAFSQVAINPDSYRTFVVTVEAAAYPRDGDSLDFYLLPSLDIQTADGSPVAGPDTLNSLGFDITDGMVASEIHIIPTGAATVAPDGQLARVLAVDLPRNGYANDALQIFTVFNSGTADTADIDSLFLFADDGDGVWERNGQDQRLGALSFTGGQWQVSGLASALTRQTQRFYLGAKVATSATSGATIAFGIPLHGVEVASQNDGPIDLAVNPVETLTIVRTPGVSVRVLPVPARDLVPGGPSGPMLCLEFTNTYTSAVRLDSLRLDCAAADPGGATRQELDSQIERVSLYLDRDGEYLLHGPSDTLLGTGLLANGCVTLKPSGLSLPQGGSVTVFVEADLSLENCKNANTVSFSVPAAERIALNKPAPISGAFPLRNPEDFPIDIFPARAAAVNAVDDASLFGGQTNRLVFDFELPSNGYDQDVLASITITNIAALNEGSVLSVVRLWADTGAPGFSGNEALLGRFEHVGSSWVASNLAATIPVGGRRFFVTVDLAAAYSVGGTLHFQIPVGGVTYLSGADGPDDEPIAALQSHLVLPADRITVIPIPREPATVYPGTENAEILCFALYNGYASKSHELTGIRLANQTRSASTPAYADRELGQVSLYCDANGTKAFDDDQLVASGYFANGSLVLGGLAVTLAPESLYYFFVVADPGLDAIDGDTLAIVINSLSDLAFGDVVRTNGDFPVSSGGPIRVDGSVSAQYQVMPIPARVAAPGDTAVALLALKPAANGDQADTLTALTLTNEGDAGPADVTSLRLWYDDDGDGQWQPTDRSLGILAPAGGQWTIENLSLAVSDSSRCLFVTGDIAPSATPGKSFRAAVPVGGCQYTSANDGPLDAGLVADEAVVISSSGLEIAHGRLRATYSVGQTICLPIDLTNATAAPLGQVTCRILALGDTSTVRLDSTQVAPVDLGAGEVAHFYACFTAISQGTISWQLQGFSSLPAESSAVLTTGDISIQTVPSSIHVGIVSSTPTAVARGQDEVFPMSIQYRRSDASPFAAPVRLDSIRIAVEDSKGVPIAANTVFSRVVLSTGYANLAVLQTVAAEPTITLIFTEPAVLMTNGDQVLSFHADIDSNATATSFALAIDDAGAMKFADCNTRNPVAIDPAVTFPLKTPACRINNPSRTAEVSYVPLVGPAINYGQQGVDVMSVMLRHPGRADDSQIQLTRLGFELVDDAGGLLDPSELVDRVDLVEKGSVVGEIDNFDAGADRIWMWLAAPPVISPSIIDTLYLRVSLKAETPYSAFGLVIPDSTCFGLRDLSSGALVAATGAGPGGAEGVFPMASGVASLRRPALAPEFCLESRLPASVIAGSASVPLIRLHLSYPARGGADCSPAIIREVRVAVLDSLARPLDPYEIFHRIGYHKVGELAAFTSSFVLRDGCTVFSLGQHGITLRPGDDIAIDLVADIEGVTSYDHMVLAVPAEGGLNVVDATDPATSPGLASAESCATNLPFVTPVAEIVMPAGSPLVRVSALAPRLAHAGQSAVSVFEAGLSYGGSDPLGSIRMVRWGAKVLQRTQAGLAAAQAAQIFQAVRLVADGVVVASDSVLSGDSISLDLGPSYVIPRGSNRALGILCDIAPEAPPGNYVLEFEDSTFAAFVDNGLERSVLPVVVGAAYPIYSADISVAPGTLAGSFTNWPNPFSAAEGTTIGYMLAEDARVDIRIYTVTGDLVKAVASGVSRSAGSHNEDTWHGANDLGMDVLPGAYICEISVTYESGRTEHARRKVAVLR
ncbi:MAG TPA: hypothetical protein VMU02_07520 [bacterium]|nr:hypothetical protein [bacterium]